MYTRMAQGKEACVCRGHQKCRPIKQGRVLCTKNIQIATPDQRKASLNEKAFRIILSMVIIPPTPLVSPRGGSP